MERLAGTWMDGWRNEGTEGDRERDWNSEEWWVELREAIERELDERERERKKEFELRAKNNSFAKKKMFLSYIKYRQEKITDMNHMCTELIQCAPH